MRAVAHHRARQQARLEQHLEAVADAEHRPAALGEGGHRRHDRRELRDGAGAQVVAVGEAAGQDDGVGAAEARVLVPHERRLFADHGARRVEGVVVGVRSRKHDDREGHGAPQSPASVGASQHFHPVALDDRVGQQRRRPSRPRGPRRRRDRRRRARPRRTCPAARRARRRSPASAGPRPRRGPAGRTPTASGSHTLALASSFRSFYAAALAKTRAKIASTFRSCSSRSNARSISRGVEHAHHVRIGQQQSS